MTPDELCQSLSRPTVAVVDALARLDGDLLVLGAGGKMGPSLARMAQQALAESGSPHRVIAVSRFGDPVARTELERHGIGTVACDLLDREAVSKLPDAAAVLFMAGTKFGTTTAASTTWALNAGVPLIVAERYVGVPTVVFSSGNVYPFVPVAGPHASESTRPAPVGEYAWSVLARERIFEHFSRTGQGTPTTMLFRLNYATGAALRRAGRHRDQGQRPRSSQSIVTMGHCQHHLARRRQLHGALAASSLAASAGRG